MTSFQISSAANGISDSRQGSIVYQEGPTTAQALTAWNFIISQYKNPVSESVVTKKHAIMDSTPKVLADIPKTVQNLEISFFSGTENINAKIENFEIQMTVN